jgi:hypothetical protein
MRTRLKEKKNLRIDFNKPGNDFIDKLYRIKKIFDAVNNAKTSLIILGTLIGIVITISECISYLGNISVKLIDNIPFNIFAIFSFNYLIILFLIIFIGISSLFLYTIYTMKRYMLM